MVDASELRAKTDAALQEGRAADAICYLAEIVANDPDDRKSRLALAITLGDAGHPAGALGILRAMADNLAHRGALLPALTVVRHGLKHAPNDASLIATMKRLHVRSVRAKAGSLPVPPPLKKETKEEETITADGLLELEQAERFNRITQIATTFPEAEAREPVPMPLFCELDEEAFVETVKQLHYKRVADGTTLLKEGERGDFLLVIADGNVDIEKGDKKIATIGAGSVLGEMALITGAPRSATAKASGEVELFMLNRQDVGKLANEKPQIAEELVEYCRKRMIANLLRTSPIFNHFDDDTRFDMIGRFQRVGYKTGAKLIEQGQAGQGLFVIAAGEVEVTVQKDDGASVVVANLGPGQVVGEISLLKDQNTMATVSSRGQVGCLFLPRGAFQKVLDDHPEVREYLEGLSDDRLKTSKDVHEETEFIDADDLIIL